MRNNKLILHKGSDSKRCSYRTCVLQEVHDTVQYAKRLYCGKIFFYSNKATVRANLQRNIKGVKAITMGVRDGITTTGVKMRTAPTTKAATVYYTTPDGNKVTYLDKGYSVTILARTVKKQRIGKWNNYWYYVDHGLHGDIYCSAKYAWVYAEFVKLK